MGFIINEFFASLRRTAGLIWPAEPIGRAGSQPPLPRQLADIQRTQTKPVPCEHSDSAAEILVRAHSSGLDLPQEENQGQAKSSEAKTQETQAQVYPKTGKEKRLN
jgi:hypothetical protein